MPPISSSVPFLRQQLGVRDLDRTVQKIVGDVLEILREPHQLVVHAVAGKPGELPTRSARCRSYAASCMALITGAPRPVFLFLSQPAPKPRCCSSSALSSLGYERLPDVGERSALEEAYGLNAGPERIIFALSIEAGNESGHRALKADREQGLSPAVIIRQRAARQYFGAFFHGD